MALIRRKKSLLDRIALGRTDLVLDHLAAGQPATAKVEGASLIYWCLRYGDVSAIRLLVEGGERLEGLGPDLGLSEAAYYGYWRVCEFLIERGADPNHAHVDTGETPLHAALCTANRPVFDLVVAVLVAAGADPNQATRPGVETGAFMRDSCTKGETPLHRAAAFGSEESIDRLLAAGADVEAKDVNGDSPLSWASWHTRPDAVLRKLCYGHFHVRAGRDSGFDHGLGWGFMEKDLFGKPHTM